MGIKQFLGIKWIDKNPKILLYDSATHFIQYEDCERNYRNEKVRRETL